MMHRLHLPLALIVRRVSVFAFARSNTLARLYRHYIIVPERAGYLARFSSAEKADGSAEFSLRQKVSRAVGIFLSRYLAPYQTIDAFVLSCINTNRNILLH